MVAPLIATAAAGLKTRIVMMSAQRALKATEEIGQRFSKLSERAVGNSKNNWREGARNDAEFIRNALKDVLDFQKNHGGMDMKEFIAKSNNVVGSIDVLLRGLDQNLTPVASRLRLSAGLPALAAAAESIIPSAKHFIVNFMDESKQQSSRDTDATRESSGNPDSAAARNTRPRQRG